MKTALLVIDVQRALTSGECEAFESRRVIDRINHVIRLARSSAAAVVIVQHEESDGPMEYGSDGWKLDSGLNALPSDSYVRKKTVDSFHDTELHALLQARGIGKLVICGLQSEFCIDSTTRRALALGYRVTLVGDGHSTVDSGALKAAQISAHHNVTLAKVESYGPRARVVPASQVRIEA